MSEREEKSCMEQTDTSGGAEVSANFYRAPRS